MRKIFIIFCVCIALPLQAAKPKQLTDAQILQTMKKATQFMVEKVANNGSYLWCYAPDFSRVWGELECKPSMMWIERGTPAMGNVFLDAYHATGDEYYFKAAEAAAAAVIWAQLSCGGWNYMADYAGEASLKDWYEKVAKGYTYPAQEHLHYAGNATFDDGTIDAASFLLRMYAENWDPKYRPAINKAVDFMIESQYPVGGWPQRYPLKYDFVKNGNPDYSSFITINDGVHTGNINFLLDCYRVLGDTRVLESIYRAMSCVLVLQGGSPQAGWAMQHQLDMNYSPGHARDFEPRGYSSTATAEMISNLIRFYRWTGDSKYLSRIPDAFEFLESIKYGQKEIDFFNLSIPEGQILCPTFVEIGTNKPLYLHRADGKYWVDYDPRDIITHYKSYRFIKIAALKKQYEEVLAMSKEEAVKESPFLSENTGIYEFSQYASKGSGMKEDKELIIKIVNALKDKPYWPSTPPGVSRENPGFSAAEIPTECISTSIYMQNMTRLINYLITE